MKDPSHCHWKQSCHSESKSLCDTVLSLKADLVRLNQGFWRGTLLLSVLHCQILCNLSLKIPSRLWKSGWFWLNVEKIWNFSISKNFWKNNPKICGNIFLRGLILLNWDLTLRNCHLWYFPVQLEIIIFTSPCSILDSIQLQDYPNGNGLFLYYMALHLNKHGVTHTVDGTFCCRLLCNSFSWIASHDMCPI